MLSGSSTGSTSTTLSTPFFGQASFGGNDARSIDAGSGTPVLMHDLLTEIGDMIGRPELLSFGSLPCRARERRMSPTRTVPLVN